MIKTNLAATLATAGLLTTAMFTTATLAFASGTDEPRAAGSGPAVLNQASFANCPAFAGSAGLSQYSAESWLGHLDIAVAGPNDLKDWTVQFDSESIFRYAIGSKPSAGYAVELVEPVQLRDGRLVVSVRHQEPAAGAITASVLTTPCLYIHLSTSVSQVTVIDADTGAVMKEADR